MESGRLRIAALLALSLTITGCSTMSGDSGGAGDGASVSDAGGTSTSAASAGGAWQGNPLDNPSSPLSTRIIYFGYDESQIGEEYLDIVIAHGQYLATNPTVTITVEGHADERGSREYNIALGERRANAVRNLMLAQGAADHQIRTVSYGEERPLMLGADESTWAQNRRAELLY